MADLTALILAAGQGTRMKSALPKVLHRVCGVPMVEQVIRVVRQAGFAKCVVITGFKEELVRKDLAGEDVDFVHQAEQLGTGHAVMQGAPLLTDREGYVLVICGDTPLLRSETISSLAETCRKENASAAVLTAMLDNPFGYGRVLRDEKGQMTSIVEQKDGTPEELAVHEINTGTYVFKAGPLLDALKKIDNKNAQGEYYLTDVFEIMIREGQKVIPVAAEDADETMGVNSRIQLAAALKGIVSQCLIPCGEVKGAARIAGTELLVATDAILNLIREGKTHQISNMMQSGTALGMHTLNMDLVRLMQQGYITREDAAIYTNNKAELEATLR